MRVPLLASLIASLLLTSAGSLYAACTSPSAPIGSQNWNGTAFQFCDGTTWQNFAGSQWSDGASSAIHYNSGNVGIGSTTPENKLTLASGGIGITYATATNSGGIGLGPDASSGSYNFSYTNSQGTYLTRQYGMTILPNASPEVYLAGYGGLGLITGGINRLHITTAGHVGIGTTTPLAKLDVRNGSILAGDISSTNGSVILQGYYSGSDTTAVFGTQRSSGAPVLGYGVRPSTSAAGSFLSSVSTALPRAALVVGDAATGTGDIKFYTGSSQTVAPGSAATLSPVLTILNGGNVGIGTTVPGVKLHVMGNSKIETGVLDLDPGYSIRWGGAASGIYSGSGVNDMVFTVGSSERFRVNGSSGNVGIGTAVPTQLLHVNGTAYATTFLHTSDRRLKTDISSIATAAQLTTKLRGVHFRWKKDGVPAYGVIAQEVEAVIPDAVTTNADGTKAVDYDQLIPVLIEAVKSLQVEVDALKRERAH